MPEDPKRGLIELALQAIKRITAQLLLFGIVETIVIVFLLVMVDEVSGDLLPIVWALALLIPFLAVCHFVLELMQRTREPARAKRTDETASGMDAPLTFQVSESTEFMAHAEKLMHSANHMVLIGTGLNILQNDPLVGSLMRRAATGNVELQIFLADPDSPSIEERLIEEELGTPKPSVGRSGLVGRLESILKIWSDLKEPDNVKIRLFTHYPTFALLIFDDQYYVYPYGYAKLGNFSPVIRFSRGVSADEKVIKFLDDQRRLIKDSSVSAKDWLALHHSGRPAPSSNLVAFALFFIPPQASELYELGTNILGHDVRKELLLESPYAEHVGAAREFGFHITICDALYFFERSELDRVEAEVQFVAKGFRQFDLTDLEVKVGFPDKNSLAILLRDPTGSLEALHHEFVHRIYRRARASNYTLDLDLSDSTRGTESDRYARMIERYRAPFVLGAYKPHFTLLSRVSDADRDTVSDEITREFAECLERSCHVGSLCVMTKEPGDDSWTIRKEISLG
ncbi:MAG: DUF1045 domain-containing protein [bacterium]|nr:DUF1045 domain-containing protein [bacterium]